MIDEQGLYDIYGLVHVPFWQTKLFIIGMSFIGLLLLIILLLVIRRFVFFSRSSQPYWQEVVFQLKALQKEPHLKQDPKVLYSTLTKIVKKYISIRFNTTFEGKTDTEVVQLLKKHHLFTTDVPDIRPLFEGVTPIKFAKKHQLKRKIENDINLSLVFVQRTIPKET